MHTITMEQAQSHLTEVIAKLPPGEELILTCDGTPVATIRATPPADPTPRMFGTLKGTLLYVAPDFDAIPEGFEEYLP